MCLVGMVGVSMNRSGTGCVLAFSGGLPCPGVGMVGFLSIGRSPAVFRPSAADCHVPGLAWAAFPRTGRLPSTEDCQAPGLAG